VSAADVAAALERARDAGRLLRERPARSAVDALADVLDAWRDPGSRWQKALAEALPEATGFAPETVREGLERGLASFSGDALRELLQREIGGADALDAARGRRAGAFETTAVVLAGAIPMPSLLSIAAPLALRSPVVVKPSLHDPVTAPLLARALAERDPLLGACVEVVAVRRDDQAAIAALCAADCVLATGSDAAIAALSARVAPPRRFVGYGQRFSVAVLGPDATRGERLALSVEGLALDVALWDQLGCLSPVSVHVVSGEARAADRVAEGLGAALARAESRWPRGRIATAAAAEIASARAEAEMRAAAARPDHASPAVSVAASPGTAWTVVREVDGALRPAPLHRFVRVHPAPDVDAALAALRPAAAHLAGVALAGFRDAGADVAAALADLGASRVCAPGALQSPPLAWRRDNLGVLLPLARWTDIEL